MAVCYALGSSCSTLWHTTSTCWASLARLRAAALAIAASVVAVEIKRRHQGTAVALPNDGPLPRIAAASASSHGAQPGFQGLHVARCAAHFDTLTGNLMTGGVSMP